MAIVDIHRTLGVLRIGMHALSDARTKRLLDMVVLLLDARRPISLAELRDQFSEYRTAKPEAGARAFERDKATLLEMGVPLRFVTAEDDADAPSEGGYLIDRQRYRLPELNLTADEVAVLVTTAAAARSQGEFPYRHAVEMAVRKLTFDMSGLSSRAQRRAQRAASPATPPPSRKSPAVRQGEVMLHLPTVFRSGSLVEHMELLKEAIHNCKRVTFEYDSHRTTLPPEAERETEGEPGMVGPSERTVDPYGLVYRQGAWILVGHCHRAQAFRRFRIDRILKLVIAPKPKSPDFVVPADFSLSEHGSITPWRFEREPAVTAQLFVSAQTSWVAEEDFGPATRTTTEDRGEPGTLIQFSCRNTEYLVGRVLSSSGTLRVLSPPALRQRVSEAALALVRRNADSGQFSLGDAKSAASKTSPTPARSPGGV